MIFCDTGVLLAAASKDHPSSSDAQALVTAIGAGRIAATINTAVISEILQIMAWRQARQAGTLIAGHVRRLFPTMTAIEPAQLDVATELMDRIPGLSPRIAVHAANCLAHGVREVVSTDGAFGLVSGLRRLSPSDARREWRY